MDKIFGGLVVLWLGLLVVIAVGWVLNILALLDAQVITMVETVRIIGIFLPPLGAAMGLWF